MVKKVFDVSQTKGRQTPAPTVNRDPQALVAVMIDTSPVIVEVTPELPHPQMGAFYDNEKQALFVKKDIGDSVALCQCVAAGTRPRTAFYRQRLLQPQGYGLSGNVRRLYALQKVRRGHQKLCYQPYPGGMEEQRAEGKIRAELSKTRTAMNEIHSRVSEELYRQRQERSKDRDSR